MGFDASIMTDEIGINSAVLAIGDHGVNFLVGILFMGANHLCEHLTIIY